jgi:hypothetical protein
MTDKEIASYIGRHYKTIQYKKKNNPKEYRLLKTGLMVEKLKNELCNNNSEYFIQKLKAELCLKK